MKVCESVSLVPPREHKRESKYTPIFKALTMVPEGKYMPVECRTANEASGLKQECTKRGLTAERRHKTVFIQGVALRDVIQGLDVEGCVGDPVPLANA